MERKSQSSCSNLVRPYGRARGRSNYLPRTRKELDQLLGAMSTVYFMKKFAFADRSQAELLRMTYNAFYNMVPRQLKEIGYEANIPRFIHRAAFISCMKEMGVVRHSGKGKSKYAVNDFGDGWATVTEKNYMKGQHFIRVIHTHDTGGAYYSRMHSKRVDPLNPQSFERVNTGFKCTGCKMIEPRNVTTYVTISTLMGSKGQ